MLLSDFDDPSQFKLEIAQAEYPWPSMEHTLPDKLQGDPTRQICRCFHGGKICRQSKSLSG